MKRLKFILLSMLAVLAAEAGAQQLRGEVFSLLDLDRPGLEKVKTLHEAGKDGEAAAALLDYYRTRTGVHTPDVDPDNVRIAEHEQKRADDALEHTFYVHDGYRPLNYGKEIDWRYWPVKDNELRWQLHRQKWFVPMGKAYRTTGDEKYAREWVSQYLDWIAKNPPVREGGTAADSENARFAWRPLEVSDRLQNQTTQFLLFQPSSSFTPEFLTEFLVNYHRHADYLRKNYSREGNHLLFEAQRMIYAGAFFPEFKEAPGWRKSGIDILNRQIGLQVYEDGGQYELDPHYHLATINIFFKALSMADVNGFRNEFPQSFLDTVESMIEFYMNICFPDYTNPCFSDAKITGKSAAMRNYDAWKALYPDNRQIRYFATDGREGEPPGYLSKGFPKTGFFVFRNSWKEDATMMVVKAGPPGEWHCQPDNGTFECWYNGKNLFPDSGSFIYGGEGEVMALRNWFRQTRVHNTLTLDDRNLDTTRSATRLWQPGGEVQTLVTENPGYAGLKHRRSVFFVDNRYFVIVDEAAGTAQGKINLHYQLCEGKVNIDTAAMTLTSDFEGDGNVKLQCFGPKGTTLRQEEGWRSTAYRKRTERTAVSFDADKNGAGAVRYITVIYPVEKAAQAPEIKARFKNKSFDENGLQIEVRTDGKKQTLGYRL